MFEQLAHAMLKAHGLAENPVMARNVVGSLQILPRTATFTGRTPTDVAFVEWKVPRFALASADVQKAYYQDASDIVFNMAGGRLRRDNIYIDVVHTVDGAWNFKGIRMTNAEIGAELSRA